MSAVVILSQAEETAIRESLADDDKLYLFEEKLKSICKSSNFSINNLDWDDFVSELFIAIVMDRENYLKKKIPFKVYLKVIARRVGFKMICEKFNITQKEYRFYIKVMECCEKYGIQPNVKNAYKISALSDMSISDVRLGLSIEPKVKEYDIERIDIEDISE